MNNFDVDFGVWLGKSIRGSPIDLIEMCHHKKHKPWMIFHISFFFLLIHLPIFQYLWCIVCRAFPWVLIEKEGGVKNRKKNTNELQKKHRTFFDGTTRLI